MGLVRTFREIRRRVLLVDSTVTFQIAAEQADRNAAPPRIVMFLPEPGAESYDHEDIGSGYVAGGSTQGVLCRRVCPVEFHVWMPSSGVDNDIGGEYPTDEEDPDSGTPWLVQMLIETLIDTCAPGLEILAGGWLDRDSLNLGWAYSLRATIAYPVYRTKTYQDATVTSYTVEAT